MKSAVLVAVLVLAAASCSDGSESPAEPSPSSSSSTIVGPVSTTSTTTTTITVAPTPTAAPSTGVTALDLCAGTVHRPGAVIADERLTEISGIAFSRSDPTVLWAHNDSGGTARLYATTDDGSTLDAVAVDAIAVDWEDMAAIDGTLFVADVGDNFGIRPTVRIVEIDEATRIAASFTFTYPSGRPDAEALIVEPTGSTATIITKDLTGGRSRIYEVDLTSDADVIEAIDVGEMPLDGFVTAADLSADGAVLAVRTTDAVWLADRAPGQSVAEALLQAPCPAPSVGEIQGEAIALHPDGRGYTTISEGLNPTRNDFRLP